MELGMLHRKMNIDGSSTELVIQVCQPSEVRRNEWSCAFSIQFGKKRKRSKAYGADSIQAMQVAFDLIRTHLNETFPEAKWMELPIDLAFAKAIPAAMGLKMYKKIEDYADRQVAAFVKNAEQR
jgi:hypothetical protein